MVASRGAKLHCAAGLPMRQRWLAAFASITGLPSVRLKSQPKIRVTLTVVNLKSISLWYGRVVNIVDVKSVPRV